MSEQERINLLENKINILEKALLKSVFPFMEAAHKMFKIQNGDLKNEFDYSSRATQK